MVQFLLNKQQESQRFVVRRSASAATLPVVMATEDIKTLIVVPKSLTFNLQLKDFDEVGHFPSGSSVQPIRGGRRSSS